MTDPEEAVVHVVDGHEGGNGVFIPSGGGVCI